MSKHPVLDCCGKEAVKNGFLADKAASDGVVAPLPLFFGHLVAATPVRIVAGRRLWLVSSKGLVPTRRSAVRYLPDALANLALR